MTSKREHVLNWDAVREQLGRAAAALSANQLGDRYELRAMEERTRALARRHQAASAGVDRLELVAFTLGNERYALETRYVQEIMPGAEFTAVPRTPDLLVGLTNLRGTVLAVFDLCRLFELPPAAADIRHRLILMGVQEPEFGFLADDVALLSTTTVGLTGATGSSLTKDNHELIRAVTSEGLIILDGVTLLADPRLMIQQLEEIARR